MGLIDRHAGKPWINGEEVLASDLEADIARAFQELAGNIEDVNIAAAANISGSKLSDGTVRGGTIASATIASGKLAAEALNEDKLLVGTLQTERIAAGSVATTAFDDDSADVSVGLGGSNVVTASLTTSATSQGVLIFSYVTAFMNLAGTSQSAFIARLYRDASELFSLTVLERGGTVQPQGAVPFLSTYIDTGALPSTAYDYHLNLRVDGIGSNAERRDAMIFVVDLAR